MSVMIVVFVVLFCVIPPTYCYEENPPKATDASQSIETTEETKQQIIEPTDDDKTESIIEETKVPLAEISATQTEPVKKQEENKENTPSINENKPENNTQKEPEETKPPKQETTPTEKTPTKRDMTLKGSFGFYKGSIPNSEIKEIHFQKEAPKNYQETWFANESDSKHITGYRDGNIVYIVGDKIYANYRCNYMFAGKSRYDEPLWSGLEKIVGLENIDMSTAEKTSCMFYESPLKEINGIANWNMSNVTSIEMMFSGCTELTHLDIANWDVSNVKDFSGVFQGHSWASDMKFQYLDVSKWDTSSATEMNHVFYGCAQLKEIPIDNWDVSKVKTFSHMFADCNGVENLNFSKWNTASVQSFDALLNDCHSLITIDVSGLDTKTCTQYSQMFEACINLEKIIGIETWDVSNASYYAFSETFHCCYKLKELDLSAWKCKPDNIARMFKNCYELKTVDMSGFDMSELQHITEFATHCKQLAEIKGIENWDMSIFTEESRAFEDSLIVVQKEEIQ